MDGSCWEVCAMKLISGWCARNFTTNTSHSTTLPSDTTRCQTRWCQTRRLQTGYWTTHNLSSSYFVVRVYNSSSYGQLGFCIAGGVYVTRPGQLQSEKRQVPVSNWNLIERQQRRVIDRHSKHDNDDGRTAVTQKINHRSASPAVAGARWLDTHSQ